jgi:hypothetical protein
VVHDDQRLERSCREAGLFPELAARGVDRLLTRRDLAPRELPRAREVRALRAARDEEALS